MYNQIIEDLLLLEFYEKKIGRTFLVGEQTLGKYYKQLRTITKEFVCIETPYECFISALFTYTDIHNTVNNKFPILSQCLELCNGKLSICGMLHNPYYIQENVYKFNLYFHSCSVLEATQLLYQCLGLFTNHVYYISSTYINIIYNGNDFIFSMVVCNTLDDLLINLGGTLDKQSWDPINGYITTLNTAISIAMKAYIFDICTPCCNLKYYNVMGFDAILVGLHYSNISHDKNILNVYQTLHLPNYIVELKQKDIIITRSGEDTIYSNNQLNYSLQSTNSPYKLFPIKEQTINKLQLVQYNHVPRAKFNLHHYFGNNYRIQIMGIDNDKYAALRNLTYYYNIPKELSELICYHWLIAEVYDAKNRLTMLTY